MVRAVLFFFLIFFVGYLPIPGQTVSGQTDQMDQLIMEGDSLVKTKDYESAFSSYKKAMAIALDIGNDSKVAALNKKIGVYHYRKKNYSVSGSYYRKSLALDSTSKTAADTYYNMCLLKLKLNEQDSVLPYLEKSLVLYRSHGQDRSTFNAYLSAGTIYKNRQLFDKALELLLKSYEGYKKLDDPGQLAKVCNTIGNIHNRLKNYHQALEYHQEALRLMGTQRLNDGKAVGHINTGNTFANLIVYDSAIKHYKKALLLLKNEDSDYGIVLRNLANTYQSKNDLKLAESYFRKSISAHKLSVDTTALLYGYNGITDLFLENGNLGQARYYLDSVSKLITKTSDQIVLLNFYKNKAVYSKEDKDYQSAYTYQSRYSDLYKKVYDLKTSEIVQGMQARFEYEKKVNENLQLSLANQNNLSLLERQKSLIESKNWILVLLGLLLLFSGVGYYLFLQRQKAKEQDLRIEKLEAIYQGQETIKKRIARDLHDIVTTNFDGLRLKILALPRSKNVQGLTQEIAANIHTINEQVRMVSHRLSPLEMQIKEQAFTEIIKSQLSEFQHYQKITVHIENELPKELNRLDFEVQNNVYSILLEVLNNVAKHSRATELGLFCKVKENNQMKLVIEDNGIGIDLTAKKGIGLMNIQQRAEILGGKSDIQKTENGTKVSIIFPL